MTETAESTARAGEILSGSWDAIAQARYSAEQMRDTAARSMALIAETKELLQSAKVRAWWQREA